MKLQHKNKFTGEIKGTPYTLESVVKACVDGSDYGRGELESMHATIDNQSELLAKIISHLNPSNETLTEWLANYDETIEKVQ